MLTEDDTRVAAVLLGKLRPDALELSISGTALGNNTAVPASVIVLYIMLVYITVRCLECIPSR